MRRLEMGAFDAPLLRPVFLPVDPLPLRFCFFSR
jgi:hypothetical protein